MLAYVFLQLPCLRTWCICLCVCVSSRASATAQWNVQIWSVGVWRL